MVDNEENSILIRIRGKLNEGKIKLWLEPYYSKNNMVEAEMQVSKISFVHILLDSPPNNRNSNLHRNLLISSVKL